MTALVTYKKLEPFVLFKQGDKGDSFYIILSGKVEGLQSVNPGNKKRYFNQYEHIFTLYKGETFGEQALTTDENLRTCTILIQDEVELIVINKGAFKYLVNQNKNNQIRDILAYYEDCVLLRGISKETKKQLAARSLVTRYPANAVILRQKEIPMDLYIVKNGSLKILRKIKKINIPGWKNLRSLYEKEFDLIDDEVIMEIGSLNEKEHVCDYELVNQVEMQNTI